jgi:4Fe-4S binding domain
VSRISKDERLLQLQREAAGDHLYANRVKVYPKTVHGLVRRTKWAILVTCLTIYYLLPWLRWHRGPGEPTQAVLLDISRERFYFFNLELWPQDIWLLAGLLILGAVGLFLVTSLFGRLWCGYTCPQTVWTDLFMWVEQWVEGDRNERMQRDAGAVDADVIWNARSEPSRANATVAGTSETRRGFLPIADRASPSVARNRDPAVLKALDLAWDRVLDRRRLDHVLRRCPDRNDRILDWVGLE